MLNKTFITSAYETMERGFPESRKRKRRNARLSVIKHFSYLFKNKSESSDCNKFLMHPKPEIQRIFSDAEIIDTGNSLTLKKALIYLQLGYLFSSKNIGFWLARKGYKHLKHYFVSENITILNCGPSMLSPFLAKLCEDKNDNSKYYIIQHGLYQLDYRPYDFEFKVSTCRSIVWSELLAKNYISLGMEPEKINVLPTHLFRKLKKLNISDKVLIIGESLNKINQDFDREYEIKIIEILDYLKLNSNYKEFYFKKHPRALPSSELDISLQNKGVIFNDSINLTDYGLVIGAVSTLMIEAIADGCRVLQLSMESIKSLNVGDYSLFTSVANIRDIKEIEVKIEKLRNLKENYINSEFLMVKQNYEQYYLSLIN